MSGPQSGRAGAPSWQHHRVPVEPGVTLAVDLAVPDGPRPVAPGVLCVHGLASNARLWDGMAGELVASGLAVAACDLRGHGRSDAPEEGYDFRRITDDLLAVWADLAQREGAFARPIVAGQSLGGNLAVELAWRSGSRLAGVVAVDGGTIELARRFPTWEECRERLAPPALEGLGAARFEAAVRQAHQDWPEVGIQGVLACMSRRPDGTIAPHLTRDRHLRLLRALYDHHPTARFPELEVPVLLVVADGRDPAESAAKRAAMDEALAHLRRGRGRLFVPADHDVHAQTPEEVAALVVAAVRQEFFA